MKSLMAAIALLCVSSTVLAHDIYTNLRDRNGNPCCGGEDCMPVEATVLPDGNYYLPASGEIIPADMATPSPDDRFHRCTYPLWAQSLMNLTARKHGEAHPQRDASWFQCTLRESPPAQIWGALLPPSPPAEKASAREDQAGKAGTGC